MQSILDWGKDKPAPAAVLARSMALSADAIVGITDKGMRRHGLEAGRPEAARWLNMYFNTTKTYGAALAFWLEPQLLLLTELLHTYFREAAEGNDPLDVIDGLAPLMERMLFEDVGKSPDPKQPIEPDREILRESLETVFTCFVILPCLSRFNVLPSALFRKACKGDNDALIALLSVDLMALESRRIRAEVYRVFATAKPGTCKRLQRALAGEGSQHRSPANIKALLSAFVELLLEGIDDHVNEAGTRFPKKKLQSFKMTSADLRRALDSAAYTHRGDLQDSDLPDSPEAFQKSVRRAKAELEPKDAESDKKDS